jgi:hypothetical protein
MLVFSTPKVQPYSLAYRQDVNTARSEVRVRGSESIEVRVTERSEDEGVRLLRARRLRARSRRGAIGRLRDASHHYGRRGLTASQANIRVTAMT